jgi:hypothetical protein
MSSEYPGVACTVILKYLEWNWTMLKGRTTPPTSILVHAATHANASR